MKSSLKGILVGSISALTLGIIGYIVSVIWLSTSFGISDSSELVNAIRSNQSMYYSIPYTFLCVLLSCWLATRKLAANQSTVIVAVTTITCLSIIAVPIKLVTIHMNYLPIIVGGLCSIYLHRKLNQYSLLHSDRAGLPDTRNR